MIITSLAVALFLLSGCLQKNVYYNTRHIPETDIQIEARYNTDTRKLEVKVLSRGE